MIINLIISAILYVEFTQVVHQFKWDSSVSERFCNCNQCELRHVNPFWGQSHFENGRCPLNGGLGSQGLCSSESTHPPPMWPRFKSRHRRHMWVEFVVGSLLCSERFFSGYSGIPFSSKTNIPNFNSIRNQVDEEPLCGCAISFSHYVKFYCFMFRHKFSTRVVCLHGKHTGSCTHTQCNLSFGTPPFQGLLHFSGHKIWSWKNTLIIFIIFVCITSVEGTPLFRGKGHFFPL